jgi:hypothetical protein
MTRPEKQAARIDDILPWARLVGELRGTWRPDEQMVHLRPSGTGIRLVDLRQTRSQLDRGQITCQQDACETLRHLLDQTREVPPGRPTPEKRLQSWLIATAYHHQGQIAPLAHDLTFITDEQWFPGERKDFVCDLLAVRGTAPVVIELKSVRQMTRAVEQLREAADLVDAHRGRFAMLFGAVLGRPVKLDRSCEKWLVWPAAAGHAVDPRARQLAGMGVRVVSYTERGQDFLFAVGPAVN